MTVLIIWNTFAIETFVNVGSQLMNKAVYVTSGQRFNSILCL